MANTAVAVLCKRYPIIPQFAKFAMIGFMNFFIDILILNVEMTLSGRNTGLYYTAFKAFSFLCAVTFSYFFNKHWAFQDKKKTEQGKQFSQFLFVSVIGMIFNVTAASIVVTYIAPAATFISLSGKLWGNLGAVGGAAAGLIWNFLGYKFWVFKK
ncbi:MAG TPA: GtrA family protein [Candidatus Bathyarchaeia archaeon]|nr:GtrA family protein [Candidatus Bathyarchaeia archaeon]